MGEPTEEGWAEEVLGMIAARLEALGCQHPGLSHQSTPPMFYDDWIACVVGKREAENARLREQAEAMAMALEIAWAYLGSITIATHLPSPAQYAWTTVDAALRAYRDGGCPGCSFRRQTGGHHDDVPTGDADPNCPYREGS